MTYGTLHPVAPDTQYNCQSPCRRFHHCICEWSSGTVDQLEETLRQKENHGKMKRCITFLWCNVICRYRDYLLSDTYLQLTASLTCCFESTGQLICPNRPRAICIICLIDILYHTKPNKTSVLFHTSKIKNIWWFYIDYVVQQTRKTTELNKKG